MKIVLCGAGITGLTLANRMSTLGDDVWPAWTMRRGRQAAAGAGGVTAGAVVLSLVEVLLDQSLSSSVTLDGGTP
jgi:hypothetical protein